jgi:hypothetical protein
MLVPGNLITLSDGLHKMWDNDFFCFFPSKVLDGEWRLHYLFMLPLQKMVRIHHRRPVRGGLSDVSDRFYQQVVLGLDLSFRFVENMKQRSL